MKQKNPKSQRGTAPPKRRFRIQFSHVLLVFAGMVLMELCHYVFFSAKTSGTPRIASKHQASKPPPWGELEFTPLALDRPPEHFTNMVDRPVASRWVLRRGSEEQMAALFNSVQLADPARTFLLDPAHWRRISNGYEVSPPAQVVISLSPEARRTLYAELARDPENVPQCMPFTFRMDGFNEWFSECGLTEEKIELVRKLSYTNEDNLCFADASVFREVSTANETICLLKGLWRVSTFMLAVRVDPKTDVDALIKYWGKAGPARAYKPLLESMTRVNEGASINISYFFPAFARLRLYTYPQPNDAHALQQDCFWTAMNFFNEKPDDRLFEPTYKDQQLATEYIRVPESERQFGDLLMLLGREKTALHMCVYVADEVVFTKNGANAIQPWVLMKISEMLGIYQRLRPFELVYYRRKNPPAWTDNSLYSTRCSTNTLALAPSPVLAANSRLKIDRERDGLTVVVR